MDLEKSISEMTLAEKAGICSGLDFWHTKPVERLGVPSVMVCDGPHGLRKQNDKADHAGVNDSIPAVCFPAGCATAASFDRNLLRTLGEAIGEGCQAEGVSVILGPAVNIKRSPLCGRNFEYYSEDPYLAAEAATAFIEGVQSKHVGTSLKHFAANNQEHRRMSGSSDIDERTLREIYLAAFEGPVKNAKPWTVMCSYNRINGTFASENRWLLTDVLRNEWGFDGYVMTDWGAVADRVTGLAAGLDLEMPASGGENDRRIVEAVQSGALDEAVLDDAVRRILTVNARYLAHAKPGTLWDKEAQHTLSRRVAADCMVLLKNEGGILPLRREDTLAFIGEFAAKPRYQGGGSSHINSFKTVSVLEAAEGLERVSYAKGFDIENDATDDAMMQEAVAAARKASVAVVFAGLPEAYESEGYDRKHMRLPDCQNAVIAAVAAANPNTVVALYNGSPVEMPWIDSVRGVLECYLPGQAAGEATLDVLFGDVNPSARLPETFPLRLVDNPSYPFYGGDRHGTTYAEGIFVGYRWYDRKELPVLFPFGYGLSYTTFAYRSLRLDKREMDDTDVLTVTVDVQNTGSVAGKEVVSLYVRAPELPELMRPVRELRAYTKVELQPGETKTVAFTLDKRAFAYWNVELHDWYVPTGEYVVEAAKSSREIVLAEPVTVRSTQEIPMRFTRDSIVMDILGNPRARERVGGLMQELSAMFLGNSENASEVAANAVSQEMVEAMLAYMPIRGMLSFGGGIATEEQITQILALLNA